MAGKSEAMVMRGRQEKRPIFFPPRDARNVYCMLSGGEEWVRCFTCTESVREMVIESVREDGGKRKTEKRLIYLSSTCQ